MQVVPEDAKIGGVDGDLLLNGVATHSTSVNEIPNWDVPRLM